MFIEDYNFERLTENEGLSQSTVYTIVQDSKGFIWIGTQQGLNKYDGYKFTVYKNELSDPKSIFNNYVYFIYEDSRNNLWIGTLNGGLSKYNYNDGNFENFHFPSAKEKINSNIIYCICEDSEGNLIIGTEGAGIKKFDTHEKRFVEFRFHEDYVEELLLVKTLQFDKEENLWVGTWRDGLKIFDKNGNIIKNYYHNETEKDCINSNGIRFIFRDSTDQIWIGTSKGLNKFENNKFISYGEKSVNNILHTNLKCICEDKFNNLWIGARNSSLVKFNMETETFVNLKLYDKLNSKFSSTLLESIFCDKSDVLWVGTFNSGIFKLDLQRKKFYGINNLIENSREQFKNFSTNSFLCDSQNNLWIGTDDTGLVRLNLHSTELINYKPRQDFEGLSVLDIEEDDDGNIWIATFPGALNRYNIKLNTFTNYFYSENKLEDLPFSISRFSNYSDENLWIGTYNRGLYKFNIRNKIFTRYSDLKKFNQPINSEIIKSLLLDKSGILWIGTDSGGLNKLDYENGLITCYKYDKENPDSLSDNYVNSLFEDSNNNLWIGTSNGGLNKLDKENEIFKRYDTDHGLPDNCVVGILEDNNNNLWISTKNGLSKFNTETEIFRTYDVRDGLQNKEFNEGACYKSDDDNMYFGGVYGFNFFNPNDIKDNPYIPDIVITDFQIFNSSVESSPDNLFLKKNILVTDEINLSYRESVFSFEFAALIYNDPEKNEYAYRMEGFDKEWIYCGTRRFVTYTNLEPGDYVFRVRGSNNDGIWNEEGKSIRISISPPFWKTWWFKSLGVMSIIGTTGMAYQQKLSKVEKEKKAQENFSRRLIESQETERKKIASELHDTVAHEILITKNKIALGYKDTQDPDKIKTLLNDISELSTNTLNEVRSISYNLHPHQLERLGLTKAIKSIVNNIAKSTEINFTAAIDNIDNIFSKELEINIYRIVQECFNNIIKHSRATEAVLNISRHKSNIIIIISDNGKGFSKNVTKGIGMNSIEERIKLYNGSLKINSEINKGAFMKIIIPMKKIK